MSDQPDVGLDGVVGLDHPATKNGRVSRADLYEALYDLDVGIGKRFTAVLEAINNGNDRQVQLREDFESHRDDGHPFTDRAGIAKEELKLDAKKAAVGAALLTLLTALATLAGTGGLPF
jgi:hypothetical protein